MAEQELRDARRILYEFALRKEIGEGEYLYDNEISKEKKEIIMNDIKYFEKLYTAKRKKIIFRLANKIIDTLNDPVLIDSSDRNGVFVLSTGLGGRSDDPPYGYGKDEFAEYTFEEINEAMEKIRPRLPKGWYDFDCDSNYRSITKDYPKIEQYTSAEIAGPDGEKMALANKVFECLNEIYYDVSVEKVDKKGRVMLFKHDKLHPFFTKKDETVPEVTKDDIIKSLYWINKKTIGKMYMEIDLDNDYVYLTYPPAMIERFKEQE